MLTKKCGSGFVLGKFMPLHEGHLHLLYFAQMSCHKLTIMVCSLPDDPIPGEIRYGWVRSMFPAATVVHQYDPIPQEPTEHPDFWNIWKKAIAKHCPGEEFDAVFGSEDYGWRLAQELGCEYIPVNRIRNLVPISGTAIRAKPITNWQYLPTVVRPYFVKRVALMGPESVGKTSLAVALAKHFDTVFVDEYGRRYLEEKIRSAGYRNDEFRDEDIPNIARGQMVSEDSLAHRANKLLVCDTDLLTTTFWANEFLGSCPEWIVKEAEKRKYDLTIMLSPVGMPHHQDGTRIMTDPEVREKFFTKMGARVRALNRNYVVITGPWKERFDCARLHIAELLKDC